jgi:hypothetical protein
MDSAQLFRVRNPPVSLYVRTDLRVSKACQSITIAGQSTWSSRSISIGCSALEPRHCRPRHLKNLPKEKGDQVGPSDIRTNAIGGAAQDRRSDQEGPHRGVSGSRHAEDRLRHEAADREPHPNVPHRRNSGGPHQACSSICMR